MYKFNKPDWSEEELQRCASMLREGLSASQIAPHFGLTRNAIIGRVHRSKFLTEIGLGRERTKTQKNANLRKAKHRSPAKIHAPRVPVPPKAIKPDPIKMTNIDRLRFDEMRAREKITLVALKHDECKFAVNDPAPGGVFFFCGEVLHNESSYCSHHHHRSISSGTFSERTAVGDLLRAA